METSTESTSTEASFETFDDLGTEEAEFETFDDPIEEDDEPVEAREKVKDDLKVIKDSQTDSEGKVIKEDKETKKEANKEEKEEEADEEEEEAVEAKEEKEETEEKPKSKLRLRMGNELFNIDSNATFKVKVDGETQEVTAQELINNYSGKTAWDKKFTEIGKEKKALEFEKSSLTKEKHQLLEHVNKALLPLKTKDANPMESLMYLVEMSGEDPYNAYRRIMEANLTELSSLMDMTETERELYFHKKKDELHGKIYKQRLDRQKEQESFNQVRSKIDSLRQAKNVTEEQFVEASDELETLFKEAGLDPEAVTEEDVVDYASLKPHIAKVRQLVAPFEENISQEKYGDVVAELSRYLRDGKTDEAAISELLKRHYSVEEDVKELNTKVYQKPKPKASKVATKQTESFETFDDF